MATPFLWAIRKQYPQAHITLFAHHKRQAIFENNPHINRILPYYGKGKRLLSTLWVLRKGKFNQAIVLHANDPDIVPLVRWSGAPQRVGWAESKWSHLFTHTIRRTDPPEHFMLHKKRLLESIGIPVDDLHTEIFLKTEDELPFHRDLEPWLARTDSKNRYVVMHPFGTNPQKWWPIANFFSLAKYIHEQQRLVTVFVGDPKSLEKIEQQPLFNSIYHFAAKQCGVRESAFIIKKASSMITTDSGPMHLAFAVECPTLCLFGPTQPSIHGPCFDQHLHRVIHCNPLESLSVEEVIKSWNQFIIQKI